MNGDGDESNCWTHTPSSTWQETNRAHRQHTRRKTCTVSWKWFHNHRSPTAASAAKHSSRTQPCCVHLFFSCLSCSAVESDLLCRGEKSGCKHSLLQICCVWLRPVFNLHGFEAGWGFLTLWDRNKKKKNCQRGQRDLSVWKRAWRSRLAPSICCSERI